MHNHFAMLARVCILALMLSLAGNAAAQRPDWTIEQIYSSGDGTVQFVMLSIMRDDATLAGLTLVSGDGVGGLHYYTFPHDVPINRAGRAILIATEGFAALGRVRPDFVVPNGFVLRPGSIRIRSSTNTDLLIVRFGGFQGVVWPDALDCGPDDAYCTDSVYYSRAANNTGESATIVPEGKPNFTGLWWAAGGAEPGWAVAVAHQGDIVFAAWLTYDLDDAPTWFVMPRGDPVDEATADVIGPYSYSGAIYRVTGSPFMASLFDASTVSAAAVGVATLRFPDPGGTSGNVGEFRYTIGAAPMVTKAISHEVFAEPVPVCASSVNGGPATNYQGLWWNADEPGWGLHLTHQGGVIYAVWFTYDAKGRPTWLALVALREGPTTYAGTIYRTTGPPYTGTFNPAAVTTTAVGSGTLDFYDHNEGSLAYTVGDVAGTLGITRQFFADSRPVCY